MTVSRVEAADMATAHLAGLGIVDPADVYAVARLWTQGEWGDVIGPVPFGHPDICPGAVRVLRARAGCDAAPGSHSWQAAPHRTLVPVALPAAEAGETTRARARRRGNGGWAT